MVLTLEERDQVELARKHSEWWRDELQLAWRKSPPNRELVLEVLRDMFELGLPIRVRAKSLQCWTSSDSKEREVKERKLELSGHIWKLDHEGLTLGIGLVQWRISFAHIADLGAPVPAPELAAA